ncbi:MAG: hypothetical protein IPL38_02225 [Rhodobacter sp.]|nr:hypothetical protein [Rhodobacter sp.]
MAMSDRKEWNHVPENLPLEVAPIWRWPLGLPAILRWYVGSWLADNVFWSLASWQVPANAGESPP